MLTNNRMVIPCTLSVNNRSLHFLHAGSGPPIFLLHASPMSARSLSPLIELLSKTHTVVAIDTPGYGSSEAPTTQPSDISTYADLIHEVQVSLRIPQIGIYGTATGAQIGIRYALDYPDDVSHLFLDNCAHFTDDERENILREYFPDLTPNTDGHHLKLVWDIASNLFKYFPWCFKEEQYKLSSPTPPPHMIHRFALDYIKSGSNYDWAYRAAFAHEDRENIAALKVPSHIFRWESSILKTYTDRIFEGPLPDNVDYSIVKATQDRHLQMAQSISSIYKGEDIDLQLEKSQIDPISKHIDIPTTPFPIPESTGRYLLEAWSALDKIENLSTLEQKTEAFIIWAEGIL